MRTYVYDVRILGDCQYGEDDRTVRVENVTDEAHAIQTARLIYGEEIEVAWTRRVCASFYVVSVYLVDRAYGGPEEGGWYYTTSLPIERAAPLMRVFRDIEEATEYRHKLQRALNAIWNHGRPSISSVLSEGRYHAVLDENEMPHAEPKERPHYE